MIILTCAYDNINHNYNKCLHSINNYFLDCWAFKKRVWIEICERSKSQQPSLKKLFFGWKLRNGIWLPANFFPSLPQAKVEQTNGNIFLKLQLFEFYQFKSWLFKFQQFNLRLSKLQLSKKLLFFTTVQFTTVQFTTVQFSTVQFTTVQFTTVQFTII